MKVKRFLQTLHIGVSDIHRVEIWERSQILETIFDDQIRKGDFGENADRTIIGWGIIGKRIDIHLKPID